MSDLDAMQRISALFGLDPSSPRFHEALTHPSFAHEVSGVADNQRLEFLGDAVLDLLASQYLFDEFPEAAEGELTRRRALLVSTEALADFARHHGLMEALRLGRGAQQGRVRGSDNVLADAVEALLAAVYLEQGFEAAQRVVGKVLEFGLQTSASGGKGADTKSELQERVQAMGRKAPIYAVTDKKGPAHEAEFEVAVLVEGVTLARAWGRSKRTAEREAARRALPVFERLLAESARTEQLEAPKDDAR